MKRLRPLLRDLRWITPLSLLAGLALALLSPGIWWIGWITYALILLLGLVALSALWRSGDRSKALAWMLVLAVVLRLGLGMAFSYVLPAQGNDTPVQNAGYIFADAFRRDSQAWDLANSHSSLLNAFQKTPDNADQYGGLLFVSSLVYRLGSPEAHRPWLIILLAALVSAIGVALVYKATRDAWGERLALPVGWIMALFPEAVLLGSSQMREPFLIAFVAMSIWGLVHWAEDRRSSPAWMLGGVVGLLLFNPGVAVAAILLLAGWIWLSRKERRLPWWAWAAAIGLAGLACILFVLALSSNAGPQGGLLARLLNWIRYSIHWDASMVIKNSGWIQNIFDQIPTALHLPFLIGYGILQPVLPAAIGDVQAVWPMQVVGILRGLGWFALLPFLVYAPISLLKIKDRRERMAWLWIWAATVVWIIVSAARAGGDQWDNPRYRAVLLLFQVALAVQVFFIETARQGRGLIRLIEVEVAFVISFSAWTISRYDINPNILSIRDALIAFAGLSLVFLACDWLWARYKGKKRQITNGAIR